MAPTVTQLANLALARIGEKRFVDDIEADDSTEAVVFDVIYEPTRDLVLAEMEWPFAKKEADLAALTDITRSGWTYAFTLPADCLSPRRIYTGQRLDAEEDKHPFELQSNDASDGVILLCDIPGPTLIYTAKITNSAAFPPHFADALAWALAKEFCLSIPAKTQLMATMEQRYMLALSSAKAQAKREEQSDAALDGASVRARS